VIKSIVAQRQMASGEPAAGNVVRYDYDGEAVGGAVTLVYYVPPSSGADVTSELYNKQNELLCAPDGGITGQGDGQCTDFASERSNGCIVWADTRRTPQ
jgi:hypothetical protein